MGHVPPGSLRQASEGDDVPRREHRGDRQPLRRQGALNADVGALGERIAERFLSVRGHDVLRRNLRVGRDEIDLLVAIGTDRVIVEVKSAVRATGIDPADHLDRAKVNALRRAGRSLRPPVSRIDLITVLFDGSGCDVCWTPRVA